MIIENTAAIGGYMIPNGGGCLARIGGSAPAFIIKKIDGTADATSPTPALTSYPVDETSPVSIPNEPPANKGFLITAPYGFTFEMYIGNINGMPTSAWVGDVTWYNGIRGGEFILQYSKATDTPPDTEISVPYGEYITITFDQNQAQNPVSIYKSWEV